VTKQKILVIKTGYSELLDGHTNSRKVSLGDILRTTPILHLFKQDEVKWVTDLDAFPLLEGNPFISELLPFDLPTTLQLKSEEYDRVINLEKIPGICALADEIKAKRNRYGFTFNPRTGKAEAYDNSCNILAVGANSKLKKGNKKTFQELLFKMLGAKWKKEEYVLGYKPKTEECFDFILNTKVGLKWPTKSWPDQYWNELEAKLVNGGFKVARQDKQDEKILNNLYSYIDWINQGKVIISNDSLGLHLGIALKKTVFGFFGSTPYSEIYFYNRGKAIVPDKNYDCMPCFSGTCIKEKSCMCDLLPEKAYADIMDYIRDKKSQ